jgi:hypothetical protein
MNSRKMRLAYFRQSNDSEGIEEPKKVITTVYIDVSTAFNLLSSEIPLTVEMKAGQSVEYFVDLEGPAEKQEILFVRYFHNPGDKILKKVTLISGNESTKDRHKIRQEFCAEGKTRHFLMISSLRVSDSGVIVFVRNGLINASCEIRVLGDANVTAVWVSPSNSVGSEDDEAVKLDPRFLEAGKEYRVACLVEGYPLPLVSWMFQPCLSGQDCGWRSLDSGSVSHQILNGTFQQVSVITLAMNKTG